MNPLQPPADPGSPDARRSIASTRAIKEVARVGVEDLVALAHRAAEAHALWPELVCAIVEQESAWNPWALRYEPVFYEKYIAPQIARGAIARGKAPGDADRLLLKMGAVMESSTPYPAENPNSSVSLDLDAAEARQIADALAKLELLQAWPEDVMDMSRALRARLIGQG